MNYMIATDYETLDLRGLPLIDMAGTIMQISDLKKTYINAKYVIISRTQRETLVKSDPVMYASALQLEQQFERPMSELDFIMVLEGCRVIVE